MTIARRIQMIFARWALMAFALAALGASILIAQQNPGHNDAPAGVPMQTTYDVSSLKYTATEKKNIDLVVGYYRDCVQSHHTELV